MTVFGIEKPDGTIWWLADSPHNAWMSFFTYPGNQRELMPHRLPLEEAIRAYEAIDYRCVECTVTKKDSEG